MMHTTAMNIGINDDARKNISDHLSRVLANEYFLYLKTLNFHWNITGHNFISLHQLLENQYEWLKETVDGLAERIRTLGYTAPASYKQYIKENATIDEGKGDQTADHMLQELVINHEAVIRDIRHIITEIEDFKDYATEDMLTGWLGEHEKNTWMLRSHLVSKPQ